MDYGLRTAAGDFGTARGAAAEARVNVPKADLGGATSTDGDEGTGTVRGDDGAALRIKAVAQIHVDRSARGESHLAAEEANAICAARGEVEGFVGIDAVPIAVARLLEELYELYVGYGGGLAHDSPIRRHRCKEESNGEDRPDKVIKKRVRLPLHLQPPIIPDTMAMDPHVAAAKSTVDTTRA